MITPKNVELDDIKEKLLPDIVFVDNPKSGIDFSFDKESYLSVLDSPLVRKFYQKKEIIFFERQLGDLKFFVIIFNKFDLLVLFLKSFPEEINILIDNDFGKFFTREQATEFKSYDEFTS